MENLKSKNAKTNNHLCKLFLILGQDTGGTGMKITVNGCVKNILDSNSNIWVSK